MKKRIVVLWLTLLVAVVAYSAFSVFDIEFIKNQTGNSTLDNNISLSAPSSTFNQVNSQFFQHEMEFAFATSTAKNDSIFIESTLSGKLDKGYVIPEGNLQGRGLEIPKTTDKYETVFFKFDPVLAEGIYVNTMSDLFTLITGSQNVRMKMDGFYYELNQECGNDRVILKLVAEDAASPSVIRASPSIILKKPHPDIKHVRFITFKELNFQKEGFAHIVPQLKDRFKQYLDKSGTKYTLASFSDTPIIHVYVSDTDHVKYISISWQGKQDAMFFIAGLFEMRENEGAGELKPVIPFEDGETLGKFAVKKMVTINERSFMEIDCSGWEGGYWSIYEIVPEERTWIFYMKSQGEYC